MGISLGVSVRTVNRHLAAAKCTCVSPVITAGITGETTKKHLKCPAETSAVRQVHSNFSYAVSAPPGRQD